MGRDVSIVSKHDSMLSPSVRAIVDADYKIADDATTVNFNLKSHKVFIFDAETEKRIYFGNQTAPAPVEGN